MAASLEMARKAKELAEQELAGAEAGKGIAGDAVEVALAEAEAARKGVEASMAAREHAEAEYQSDVEAFWAGIAEEDRKRQEGELEAVRRQIEERRRLQEEADRDAHQRRVADARAESQAWGDAQSTAQDRLSRAQAQVNRAWGWYRDKGSLAAQLEEEKAEAEAQRQFDKDFGRLARQRPDWATAKNLSLDQEAVRRVALARQEDKAAQAALNEIAENTAQTTELLESLLTLKDG